MNKDITSNKGASFVYKILYFFYLSSYLWGKPSPGTKVFCKFKNCHISTNLSNDVTGGVLSNAA